LVPVAGGEAQTAGVAASSGGLVQTDDVKLLGNFLKPELMSRGERIPLDSLHIEGAAYYIPGEGLAVYKGGVNEVIDPSFEGNGWALSSGAVIDNSLASSGTKSLKVAGNGSANEVAELAEPAKVVSAGSRTLSYDYYCPSYNTGALSVALNAYGADGTLLDSGSVSIRAGNEGWGRDKGFSFLLPEGTDSYNIEIDSEGFAGTCYFDAFQVEAKNYVTPYFDGDSVESEWTNAPTPLNLASALLLPKSSRLFAKAIFFGGAIFVISLIVWWISIRSMLRSKHLWRKLSYLILGVATAIVGSVVVGILPAPDIWPNALIFQGSHLNSTKTYFYRISSVDSQGVESPPSYEVRATTEWMTRKIILTWDRVPQAVQYRIYRGDISGEEDAMFELDDATAAENWKANPRQFNPGQVYDTQGNSAQFIDTGKQGISQRPVVGAHTDDARANASVSLRPFPDVRIKGSAIGLDAKSDFWVAGEAEFDYSNTLPFVPASLFEVGDPSLETSFAVSNRYVPDWGDVAPKILLIKNAERSSLPSTSYLQTPVFDSGSVIKYVAAQLYRPVNGLSAGVHLWYSIDGGEIQHTEVENTEPLTGDVFVLVSKRYFFDYFGNNSVARSFVVTQGAPDERIISGIMNNPAPIPEQIAAMMAPANS